MSPRVGAPHPQDVAMRLDAPKNLGKTVEAAILTRPIKVAYLVPCEGTPRSDGILDAVFQESYTRWAGAHTLVVPTSAESLSAGYPSWLRRFDPDFVYSYVRLTEALVKEVDALACPIAFLQHELEDSDEQTGWRQYLPQWTHYFQPISSITTLLSPTLRPRRHRGSVIPTVLTQSITQSFNRFIADNFGTRYSTTRSTSAIDGFMNTVCLAEHDVHEYLVLGSEIVKSAVDALRAVGEGRAIPIARLATMHSTGVERFSTFEWSRAFRIIVGSTPLDRINFWNSRLLTTDGESLNSIVFPPALIDDEKALAALGDYLNKNNFLGFGGGPYQAEVHSSSLSSEELEDFKTKLSRHTHTSIHIATDFAAPIIPSEKDLERAVRWSQDDLERVQLSNDVSELVATSPHHFDYVPPQFRGLAAGQWMLELTIERHVTHSKYSNVVHHWQLPRRLQVASAFTNQLAKPSRTGNLSLLPTSDTFPFAPGEGKRLLRYELRLPSDDMFFRHLVMGGRRSSGDDLRAGYASSAVSDMRISDKGQNLRGVIAMFENLASAYAILTNPYWRLVLSTASEASTRSLSFDEKKLLSLIPCDKDKKKKLREELRLPKLRLDKFLKSGFLDVMELLVRANVFHQVAHWRCTFCGHTNTRQFDAMKVENACDICRTSYFSPIDLNWNFALNEFVHRSLVMHSGLTVLWALGYLQDRSWGVYWFLPETVLGMLDSEYPIAEIDALCMVQGKFYAVEVKKSAESFVRDRSEIEKFARVIRALRPDVAMLAFARYAFDAANVEIMKQELVLVIDELRVLVGGVTRFEVVVAEDSEGYSNFAGDFGWSGSRTSDVLREASARGSD